ncbi:hypothetical protein SDB61_09690 [Legionella pneumophila serogroup 1]
MRIILTILSVLSLCIKSHAFELNYPKSINVWNAKDQSKIIGECKNLDRNNSKYNDYPRRIECKFTQIKIKKHTKSTSNLTESILLPFMLDSRNVKTKEELKLVLCKEFIDYRDTFNLNDPYDKQEYISYIQLCEKNGSIEKYIKTATNNLIADSKLNVCYLYVDNYSIDFKYSEPQEMWISEPMHQDKYCNDLVVTSLYRSDKFTWNYMDTYIGSNMNGTIDNFCKKNSSANKNIIYYGSQRFSKNENTNNTDIISSVNSIYTGCDRFNLAEQI